MSGPSLVLLSEGASVDDVRRRLAALGLWTRVLTDGAGSALVVDERSARFVVADVLAVPGVARVLAEPVATPRLVRMARPVEAGPIAFGPGAPVVVAAGPCAVETEEQIERLAARVKASGARALRGGAYKPRTSPYAFAGRGAPALDELATAARRHGLALVTEVIRTEDVDAVARRADMLQVGARSMGYAPLLEAAGATGKPVLVKRNPSASLDELLLAAERVLHAGASGVVVCERGVQASDPAFRNLLDLGAVAHLAALGVPVVVDPSHATGRRDLVVALARAAVAAGAHGVLVEVHDRPAEALSDAPQAIDGDALDALVRAVAHAATAPPGSGGDRSET